MFVLMLPNRVQNRRIKNGNKFIEMPKTEVKYNNKITLKMSGQFLNYINIARMLPGTKKKFGKHPTQTEFLRGVIYYWIKKHAPEILIDDLKGNVPEILEHKALKENNKKRAKQ